MEKLNFNAIFQEFKESSERVGEFEGLLVNYNHKNLAHGIYRFAKGSMKMNEGKTLSILYNHNSKEIPVGTMTGVDTDEGFKVTAKFDLSKDEGGYINKDAAKLYNLMKAGVKFELSTGGWLVKCEEKRENGKTFYDITKFDADEGSITLRGAVHGSKVTKVFNDNGGNEDMTREEMQELLKQGLQQFAKDMVNAQKDEEIEALPKKFSELEEKFNKIKDDVSKEFSEVVEEKFEEFNKVIKGLKKEFTPTEKEIGRAQEFLSVINELNKGAKKFTIDETTMLNFATTGTTEETKTKAGVRSQYLTGILKRLQEANPLFAKLRIVSISENSLELDREEIGLPEVAWVGETDTRSETDINALKDVEIKLHQIYALPKLSNKLIATNYVGYVDFLLERVEYAWGLKLANTMLNGTGTKQPLGILKDTNVTNSVEWASGVTDEELADSIVTTYNSIRDEIASKSDWIMRRETWVKLSKIKDKDGRYRITDIKDGSERRLMGRPVIIIDSANSGLKTFDEASSTEPVAVFGDVTNGMLGIENSKLVMNIKDQITEKGFTKYYMEKLLGFGVVLPECFTVVKKGA